MAWQCIALDRIDSGRRNDFVSATDCRPYCRQVFEMKKRVALIGVIAVLVLSGAVYVWGPSSVPAGQEQLVTLSNANFNEFENAFDADTNVPRLVLLLSPT